MTPERNVRLAPHTSLRVGGPADYFFMARSAAELTEALRWATEHEVPVRVIGGGSNLLVAEAGVDGLVIKVAHASFEVEGHVVRADAGVNLANMARRLAKQGYGGLEWAANVPGTVGGAVVNNAGAFGGDTASCVDSVTLADADGNSMKVSAAQLQYGYRTSVLKRHGLAYSPAPKPRESRDMGRLEPREGGDSGVLALRELGSVGVVEATLKVLPSTPEEADGRVKEFNARRMRSQPRILSAGSVFANPDGGFAGKLIEDAGLKGTWLGGAQISEQHANFIVNPGAATADDVYALVCRAQRMVFERLGIWLCPEIELFGRWSPEQRLVVRG